jgi:hypothetical protein
MKKYILYLLIITSVIQACRPSTVITASWKSPTPQTKRYERIMVAALTSNTIAKATVENDIASAISGSVTVLKSIDELPPGINNADTDKVVIMNKVKNKNVDAILTISLINKETESRYIPGAYPYNPLGYGYYNNFWGYYSYWYPYAYSQGYYIQEKIYFIETNLYDVKTEKLIWSAQSKTYDPGNLKIFSKEFATIIAERLRKDGVLYTAPQS